MINLDWKIKARAHACSVTGEPFADKEIFYTAIFEGADEEGFGRRDYSSAAWESARSELKPFSHWRSVYEEPKPEEKLEVVEKENAEGLLRRLIEEDDCLTENARFILAVMLERKKTIRETDSRSLGEATLRIYEHTKTGEVFIVRDPMLHLTQIEAVQKEVAALLGGASEQPSAPPTSGTPPEPVAT